MNKLDYEEYRINFEYQRNLAMDKWFRARPDVFRDEESERLFEGGFRLAFDLTPGQREGLE